MLVSHDYPDLLIKVTIRTLALPFQALLDTGFDGHLVLPAVLGNQLGTPDYLVKTRLADNSENAFPAYLGGVEVVGLGLVYMARLTLLGNECLMGQGIIKRLRVTFDHGTQILVET